MFSASSFVIPKLFANQQNVISWEKKKNVNYRTGETEIEMCELA